MEKIKCTTIDEYISLQPEKMHYTLEVLRQTIRDAAPEAEEIISYSMPAFRQNGMLCWFHCYKNHYALYVRPKFMAPFVSRLSAYKTSQSAIQFPIHSSVPVELVTDIVAYAVQCNLNAIGEKKVKTKKEI